MFPGPEARAQGVWTLTQAWQGSLCWVGAGEASGIWSGAPAAKLTLWSIYSAVRYGFQSFT